MISLSADSTTLPLTRYSGFTKAMTIKNGKQATQGVCPVCGTKMFKIGKA